MKAQVLFKKCVQNVQVVGSVDGNDDRMVSRITFDLSFAGTLYPDMIVEIRQPHGFDFRDPDTYPIEVSRPVGVYPGPWNHESLSSAVDRYYRGLIGQQGRMVSFDNTSSISMSNNVMTHPSMDTVEIPDKCGPW